MFRKTIIMICTLALVTSVVYAGAPAVVTVVGQADPQVDRQNIQDAVDAASPGTTIVLDGTFLLDGERIFLTTSHLTLTGQAVDNDGDGEVNEDWQDGVDNDGDAAVDEDDWDTVVQGLANPDGTPVNDGDLDIYFNRALAIEGVTGSARHIAIRHIKFSTHDRAINIFPDWFPGTKLCADYVFTDGTLGHVTIEHNWFDNNMRGIGVHGAVEGLRVRNNLFTDQLSGGVLLFGQEYACGGDDGFDLPVAMGTPLRSLLSDNAFTSATAWGVISIATDFTTIVRNTFELGIFGVYLTGDSRALVTRNQVRDVVYGILVEGGEKVFVLDNDVAGGVFGLYGALASPHTKFFNNTVAQSAYFGLYFELEATGFTAALNAFEGSGVADVFLDESTFENTVISTRSVTTVMDLGVDNRLIGLIE
ncbi:MAG: hypothetical protein GY856_07360 [bacterium]|nr:hypothetical protein [bacterium]